MRAVRSLNTITREESSTASSTPFYIILRVYAPAPTVSEGLKNPATFQVPPAIGSIG
jgi:hypothetical protein